MSTFSGINNASRALGAAQRGMETTGQNIANVNTPGYSRQRVEQSASVLNQTGQFTQKHVPGDGVVVNGLTRVNDALATATARQDSANAQEQATAATVLSAAEAAIGDTGTTGLSKDLADLTSAWNSLVNAGTTGLEGAKSLVVTTSQSVAATISGMDQQLQGQYAQLGLQAETLVTQANTASANIARLNTSIRETLASGASANELLDQRDQYLNQLADLTGARTVARENGTVDVLVGNTFVVNGDFAHDMTVGYRASDGTTPGNPQLRRGDQLVVTVGNQTTAPVSGSLKATIDGANTTLAKQWDGLNTFTQKFAADVNAKYDSTGTRKFFTPAGGDTTITAHSLQVEASLVASPTALVDSPAGLSDRSVAKDVLATFGGSAGTKATWQANVTKLAASTQSANNRAELASQVSLKSSAVRDGVSGVNLDEEMTNLVAYQHAYSAAAKVLTTMDQALDALLNMVR
ncbi:flagellar hook-associated protein FlgK [Kineococcus aurantiacus]|uniref:Flagellar hook-associated protein 1 n=1 Tax=Kineococcus aurantiacus TaxID=37633 RepID=A0A7Y9DPX5_9ACTN|nr:flagellar hook-associated protein FlgK [Kineococcus aurantiacus]NYD24573.1 flagellar hook-associated protein 1 FlgK [Kineococcus aurantiacus]